MLSADPRPCIAAHDPNQSYPTATPFASPSYSERIRIPVPFAELHPLARVRALRTMADRTPGLDRHGFDVLTALALRMDEHGRVSVGQVRIASEARCSERTARSRLAVLARVGLVQRQRSGPRGLTRYQLAHPTADALDAPTAARVTVPVQTGTDAPEERSGRPPAPGTNPDTLDARQRPPAPATGTDVQTGTGDALDAFRGVTDVTATPSGVTVPPRTADGQTGTATRHDATTPAVRPAPPVRVDPSRPARWGASKGSKTEGKNTRTREAADRHGPRPILAPPRHRPLAALTAREPAPDPAAALATLKASPFARDARRQWRREETGVLVFDLTADDAPPSMATG